MAGTYAEAENDLRTQAIGPAVQGVYPHLSIMRLNAASVIRETSRRMQFRQLRGYRVARERACNRKCCKKI